MGLDIAGPVSTVTAYPASTPDELEETGKLVEAHGGRNFVAVKADIRDLPALKEAAARVVEGTRPVWMSSSPTRVSKGFKPLLEMEDKHWHDVIDVNLTGSANTLRAFAPVLVETEAGRAHHPGRVPTQGRHGSKDAAAYSRLEVGHLRPDENGRARTR